MRIYTRHIPFLLILCVFIAGCQSADSFALPTLELLPSITSTSISPELTYETITPAVTAATKNPAETPTIPVERKNAFDCDGPVCQSTWLGELKRPIGNNYRKTIDLTYPYASTKDGILDPHHGVEFPNPFGTPVVAAAPGEVIFAGSDQSTLLGPYKNFYGNVVILAHPELFQGQDVYTLYAHLSRIEVAKGESIGVGEKVGEVGATGVADGAHLHFEVRLGGNDYGLTVNPVLWFAPFQPPGSQTFAHLSGVILGINGQPLSEFGFVLEEIDQNGHIVETYYPKTYNENGANSHPLLGENFLFPDIPYGTYRLSFVSGRVYETTITIAPGELAFLKLQVD